MAASPSSQHIVRQPHWFAAWLGITCFAVTCGLGGWFVGILQPLDGRLYDSGITSRPASPNDEIVIVGIDEDFMAGRHPYLAPRDRLAELLDAMTPHKPVVIVLDVILDSRIDENANGVDARLRKALLNAKQRGVPVLLAERAENVFRTTPVAGVRQPLASVTAGGGVLPFFAEASGGVGNIDLDLDGDGVVRMVPRTVEGLASMPALAVQAARKGSAALAVARDTPIEFRTPPGEWQITPAATFLKQPILAALLQGKIVFIGATYTRSGDVKTTPYSSLASNSDKTRRDLYGIEVLAQATATILHPSRRGSHAEGIIWPNVMLVTALAAAVIAALALRGAWWGIASAVVCGGGATMLAVASARSPQSFGGHFWPASPLLLGGALAAILAVGYRQLSEAREVRRLNDAFSVYVGEEVMRTFKGRMPNIGGELRSIAVLFCDIRGYSALAETMRDDPERLMTTLNAHFDPLVKALKDRGAYVDNYVGDLVMAVFGAPVADDSLPADTYRGVLAALDFVRITHERNIERQAAGEMPIEVGIGMHCGQAVVGNLGSERRIHYTAIGDAVNIASRVESTTRKYDVPLLVTEEVVQACAAHPPAAELRWEFVDETQVKGRQAPVRLYRSLNMAGAVATKKEES